MEAICDIIVTLIEKTPWIAISIVAISARKLAPRDIWMSRNDFKFHIKF